MNFTDSLAPHSLNFLDAPTRWIGMYVAAASLLCTLAMIADIFYGLRNKMFWFPSKYFALNATSLTLLAVALKLPVDLSTWMYAVTDRLANVSSLVFMSTAMANFLPSLGSMDNTDMLSNVFALAILVITIFVNVCIQMSEVHSFLRDKRAFAEEIVALVCMLVLLLMLTSLAIMIPSAKRKLQRKYHDMSKSSLKEERLKMGRVSTDKLRVVVKKCWLMEESNTPQFVVSRSVISTTSGFMSMVIALVLVEAQIRFAMETNILTQSKSNYKWSTRWILAIQTIGVIVGTITPSFRWLNSARRKSILIGDKGIKSVFIVEGYWIQTLVEWKQSPLPVEIRHLQCRKVVHYTRGLILDFCIGVQYVIVIYSKLLLTISFCLTRRFIFCFNSIRRLMMQRFKSDSGSSHSNEIPELTVDSVSDYVMLLEGEHPLCNVTLKRIYKMLDKTIQKGKMQKPKDLLQLLSKSCNFNGVMDFDSCEVPSLNLQELPYCWSLPVVTLTSIALALPNIEKEKSDWLLNSVVEGLAYVKLVDKIHEKERSLENIINVADVFWVGVELYSKWQDVDLEEASHKWKKSEEILLKLSSEAEGTVLEFKRNTKDIPMTDPLDWPADVIAANSMYRISRTVLLNHKSKFYQTDEELFEKLSVMIADIMAACFTNLGRVIIMKCYCNAIEDREKDIRLAALLLGETEEIISLLQQREMPPLLTSDNAADIEEWRAISKLEHKNNQESVSMSGNEIDDAGAKFREEHVAINVNG